LPSFKKIYIYYDKSTNATNNIIKNNYKYLFSMVKGGGGESPVRNAQMSFFNANAKTKLKM
jgi:hypothetical protein